MQTFNVGSDLSDKQRKKPPKIGTIATYRFQELTKNSVPRLPSYISGAIDKDKLHVDIWHANVIGYYAGLCTLPKPELVDEHPATEAC